MKKIIDRIVIIIWVAVLLFLCTTFLTQCSLMYVNEDLTSDNLTLHPHRVLKTCFASSYTWPSDDQSAVLTIPDTCEGYRVTALGGYVGSGGPCPFSVNLPNSTGVFSGYSDDTLPADAQIEQYHLVLNIGKHIWDDEFVVMDDYHRVGPDQYVQVLVTVNCSPKNPFFYAEDGKLYRRLDHSLVEGFFYYSDYVG